MNQNSPRAKETKRNSIVSAQDRQEQGIRVTINKQIYPYEYERSEIHSGSIAMNSEYAPSVESRKGIRQIM